jgi:4-amino-4-deoxy-L-arabinose transferase-like glycosyltransferase
LAILALALALRLWGLEQNGWGAEYYTAAVRSMALNLHNFFYNAFDPAGFISLDKPPVALWPQVLGVKLLGFQPFSVLLPQVLEGVASVGLLFAMTRRRLGAMPALLAALFLAITPVWVAVNRTNNTDSCLLLVLLLAADALLRAAERGSRPWLLGSMAWLGLAFNVKMLAAFVVLPAFVLVYALAAPLAWRRRLLDLTLAGGLLLACSLPWVLAVELTPADQRPYVGSSSGNSLLELIVGHNAFNRFVSKSKALAIDTPRPDPPPAPGQAPAPAPGPGLQERSQVGEAVSRLFVRVPTGPLRLAQGRLAGQVAWLLPLALLAVWVGVHRGWLRKPWPPAGLALIFWLAWSAICVLVYSQLGGIFHFYYLAPLAPALAVLAALGLSGLWEQFRQGTWRALLLPAALTLTAAWQLHVEASALGWPWLARGGPGEQWLGWLSWGVAGGVLAASAALLALGPRGAPGPRGPGLAKGGLALGLTALLALPLAWSLSSVLLPGQGVLPSADPHRFTRAYPDAATRAALRQRHEADTARLIGFLQANHRGERYLLSSSTYQVAAPIIIRTGQAVQARGGFHGLDNAASPQSLAELVAQRQVRFVMLGDVAPVSRRMGADRVGQPVAQWVRAHGQSVDPKLWRASAQTGGLELFDLRPGEALVNPGD